MQRMRRQEEAKIRPWRTDFLSPRLYRSPGIDGTAEWQTPFAGQIQLLFFVSSNFAWCQRRNPVADRRRMPPGDSKWRKRIEPFGEGSGDRSNGRMSAPVVGAPWEKLRNLTCSPMDSLTIEIKNDDENDGEFSITPRRQRQALGRCSSCGLFPGCRAFFQREHW
jgi:hypothetical protein